MPTLLTEDEYKATWGPEPASVGLDDAPSFHFWPYFDSIVEEDFAGHDFSEGQVAYAWQMPGDRHQHVLIARQTPNVFLVLVLDLRVLSVVGHHLLDLNRLYGLT